MAGRLAAHTPFVIETLACEPDCRAAKADAEEWRVCDPDHRFHPAGWTHLTLVRIERFEEVDVSHAGNGTTRRRYRPGPFGLIPSSPPLIVPSGLFFTSPSA